MSKLHPTKTPLEAAKESDAELLSRVCHGEYAAFGAIYDRHHEAVARFVRRATCDSPDAEDILQEAFLIAARKASSFDGRASCRPWLIGIAAGELLHRKRSFVRLQAFLQRYRRTEADPPRDPHQQLERRRDVLRLEAALRSLTEPKRVVLLMVEIEGMTCEQVATALDIPLGTVWTRLHHARKALRQALDEKERA